MPELVLHLKPREARRVRRGHPWVFSNEIARIEPETLPSGTCRVVDDSGRYLGSGYYNRHSLISARILTRDDGRELDEQLFADRLEAARAKRLAVYGSEEAFRWVYGEADRLPGLVVDLYPGVIVAQVTTLGMEELASRWEPALLRQAEGRRLIYRNDSSLRTREGLGLFTSRPAAPEDRYIDFTEAGAPVTALPYTGQKTGYFLDQRENRIWLRRLASDASVLDLYAYTGAWGLGMLHAGARRAVLVDSSRTALGGAERAVERAGAQDRCELIRSDAEAYLRSVRSSRTQFDVVIADPPDLIPTRKALGPGRRRYLALFRAALECVRPRGFAALSSCSFHLPDADFDRIVSDAAHRAGRDIQVIWRGSASPDHPRPVQMPESYYLKCVVVAAT